MRLVTSMPTVPSAFSSPWMSAAPESSWSVPASVQAANSRERRRRERFMSGVSGLDRDGGETGEPATRGDADDVVVHLDGADLVDHDAGEVLRDERAQRVDLRLVVAVAEAREHPVERVDVDRRARRQTEHREEARGGATGVGLARPRLRLE